MAIAWRFRAADEEPPGADAADGLGAAEDGRLALAATAVDAGAWTFPAYADTALRTGLISCDESPTSLDSLMYFRDTACAAGPLPPKDTGTLPLPPDHAFALPLPPDEAVALFTSRSDGLRDSALDFPPDCPPVLLLDMTVMAAKTTVSRAEMVATDRVR